MINLALLIFSGILGGFWVGWWAGQRFGRLRAVLGRQRARRHRIEVDWDLLQAAAEGAGFHLVRKVADDEVH